MDSPIAPSAIASPEVTPPVTPPEAQNVAPAQTSAQAAPVAKREPGRHRDDCTCLFCERRKKKGQQSPSDGSGSGKSSNRKSKKDGKQSGLTNTSSTSIPQKVAAMRAEQAAVNTSAKESNEPDGPAKTITWWDALANPLGAN
jgi:hypothetical protein